MGHNTYNFRICFQTEGTAALMQDQIMAELDIRIPRLCIIQEIIKNNTSDQRTL